MDATEAYLVGISKEAKTSIKSGLLQNKEYSAFCYRQ